ncbi:MAG: thiamine-phosphate kinase [Alphaproteobacteria bacterium]|nr:thiamine-phosphate kinase [Alphaproteobacteria bacterium]MBU1513652.1 thiamine-phosphate kinase [Alphaproteobacteria bacterium]MBU2094703.1 thiamine-phosphate kinase [Alphaproteobacteria bacterium]MBU2150228.1 thiamine-phosphate kinase [Alphaproteobacteria bacterium]MBU2309243.1 thiamine-phosphate kinase [Alphaproteobacteria bacterium]
MSGLPPDPPTGKLDEFGEIARLFRPLTRGAPGAFDLTDDAAIIPQRAGFDLVVTKDAIVEGVHFPVGEAPELVARKLVRVNLSDLAAKAAEPFAAFLAVAWPQGFSDRDREHFAMGLAADLEAYGVSLMGGDTVTTPGSFMCTLTAMGWVPAGRMVRRAGARPGDKLLVSGTIGDATLGLAAVKGEVDDPDGRLAHRYRLPEPRVDLRETLRRHATAAADVSDGLIADARHIAEASGVGLQIDLDRIPLSGAAATWLEHQADVGASLLRLGTGGDDYEVVCTMASGVRKPAGFTVIGEVREGHGVEVLAAGRPVDPGQGGWRHG